MPDDLGAADRLLVAGQPQLDERVDDRVELLLGRIPRLEQVVVEVDDVDGLDGRVGVGVGGEQGAPGVGEEVHRLLQELEAAHLGHPVVGEQHRHARRPEASAHAASRAPAGPDSVRTTRYASP